VTSRQADKRLLVLALWSGLVAAPIVSAAAQSVPCADSTTTKHGVYTAQQAIRGKDVYAGNCKSCHSPESHTGATFNATWNHRSLSELYGYIRDRMPKNEPGSLSEQEYVDVLAYLLRMNKMPSGRRELTPDSLAMQSIRIEIVK
jgi:mono/diheme cytochrome c family protein